MAKQRIVRVYPNGWTNTTEHLVKALDEGWTILMVNTVSDGKYTFNDYILTKEDENESK